MNTPLTPEERLFQVIENGEPAPQKESPNKILQWFKKLSFSRKEGGRSGFDLSFVNRTLAICVILLLIGAGANVFLFKPDMNRVYERVAKANAPLSSDKEAIDSRRPVEDYLYAIARRNLFEPGGETSAKPTDLKIPRSSIKGVLGNLELVGISWGEYPEAMIRKKDDGRTHFIQQGHKFEKILVKEILKDRVIVEYGGEIRELM